MAFAARAGVDAVDLERGAECPEQHHVKLMGSADQEADRIAHRSEVRSDVDSAKLAMLIVSTLEGSFMIRRLQKKDGPLDLACDHLEEYLESKVRARQSKAGGR